MQKAHRSDRLKKTRRPGQPAIPHQGFRNLLDMGKEGGEIVVANLGAIHLDPFIDAAEVRGGVKAGLVAGAGQDAGQSGRS